MLARPLKVLFVSAEVAPFSSIGGLSQVSYFLPRALLKLGVDIRIFTPKYGTVIEKKFPLKMMIEGLKIPTGVGKSEAENDSEQPRELVSNIKFFAETRKGEPTVYFLENEEYYEKRANVYGYSDDHIRFGLLSRGAVEFVKNGFFEPDIVHLNDWHTSYTANYLRDTFGDDPELSKIAIVQSIHNLFQGNFDFEHASTMDFDDGKGELASFFSDRFLKQNALKRGVMRADLVNTVSETYAAEIVTDEYGKGLQDLFKEVRGKIYGVLNGLDYTDFNPQTDKVVKVNYNSQSVRKRVENKNDLQRQFGLEVSAEKPLMSFWGRVDWQKGIDLIVAVIETVLVETNAQFIIMGQPGDDNFRKFFLDLEKKFPGRVGTHLMSNFTLPRKIASGADMLLHPSRYEPGGIVAVEALRYGCVPIVRATGGLGDIVSDYSPERETGNGFSFKNFSKESFLVAIIRALETYRNRDAWRRIVRRGMETDLSWGRSAEKYLDLYRRAMEFRKEALLPNPPRAYKQTIG